MRSSIDPTQPTPQKETFTQCAQGGSVLAWLEILEDPRRVRSLVVLGSARPEELRAVAGLSGLERLTIDSRRLSERDLLLLRPLAGLVTLTLEGASRLSLWGLACLLRAMPNLERLTLSVQRRTNTVWRSGGPRPGETETVVLDDPMQFEVLLQWSHRDTHALDRHKVLTSGLLGAAGLKNPNASVLALLAWGP